MRHYQLTLQPEEELMAKVFETPLVHAWRFFLLGLWTLLPFFFLFPLLQRGILGVIIFLVVASSGAFLLFYVYYQWKHTCLFITDRRVIDVEQQGWMNFEVYEVGHAQVKDVEVKRRGPWAYLFSYGNVEIEIAHAPENLLFPRVKHPKRTQYLLLDLRDYTRGLLH